MCLRGYVFIVNYNGLLFANKCTIVKNNVFLKHGWFYHCKGNGFRKHVFEVAWISHGRLSHALETLFSLLEHFLAFATSWPLGFSFRKPWISILSRPLVIVECKKCVLHLWTYVLIYHSKRMFPSTIIGTSSRSLTTLQICRTSLKIVWISQIEENLRKLLETVDSA